MDMGRVDVWKWATGERGEHGGGNVAGKSIEKLLTIRSFLEH